MHMEARSRSAGLNQTSNPHNSACFDCAALDRGTILIQPASHEMPGLRFKVRRKFYIAQARHEVRATRMETASRRRIHQAGWLARRHFFERFGIARIGIRGGGQQGMSIGMKRIVKQAACFRLFDQIAGVHHEDTPRKIFHRGKIVRNIDHGKPM